MINNNQECTLNHTTRVNESIVQRAHMRNTVWIHYVMRHYCHTTSLPPIIQQLLTNNIYYKYYTYVVTAVCQHFMMCIGLDNAEYVVRLSWCCLDNI